MDGLDHVWSKATKREATPMEFITVPAKAAWKAICSLASTISSLAKSAFYAINSAFASNKKDKARYARKAESAQNEAVRNFEHTKLDASHVGEVTERIATTGRVDREGVKVVKEAGRKTKAEGKTWLGRAEKVADRLIPDALVDW